MLTAFLLSYHKAVKLATKSGRMWASAPTMEKRDFLAGDDAHIVPLCRRI